MYKQKFYGYIHIYYVLLIEFSISTHFNKHPKANDFKSTLKFAISTIPTFHLHHSYFILYLNTLEVVVIYIHDGDKVLTPTYTYYFRILELDGFRDWIQKKN